MHKKGVYVEQSPLIFTVCGNGNEAILSYKVDSSLSAKSGEFLHSQ